MSLCLGELTDLPCCSFGRSEESNYNKPNYINHLAKSVLMCEQFTRESSLFGDERRFQSSLGSKQIFQKMLESGLQFMRICHPKLLFILVLLIKMVKLDN